LSIVKSMNITLSVNEAIKQLAMVRETQISIQGLLEFEFEATALWHFPKAERVNGYGSSIWLRTDKFNHETWFRLHGKRVLITGVLHEPDATGGCGHMSLWPAELEAFSIERQ
jgi:hypothetical protein